VCDNCPDDENDDRTIRRDGFRHACDTARHSNAGQADGERSVGDLCTTADDLTAPDRFRRDGLGAPADNCPFSRANQAMAMTTAR